MVKEIKINEALFIFQMLRCNLCVQYLLENELEPVSISSSSVVMEAYLEKMTEIGGLIERYKALFKSDLAALKQAKQEILAADAAAAQGFRE